MSFLSNSSTSGLFLTTSEGNQLENINSVTISNTQWGYVGAMDQGVASTDTVEVATLGINEASPSKLLHITDNATESELIYLQNNKAGNTANTVRITTRLETDTTTRSAMSIFSSFSSITDASRTSKTEIKQSDAGTFDTVLDLTGHDVDAPNGTLSEAGVRVATGAGTTGGSGSAGAGNQYIEISVAGTTYKVLHDGTV